MPNPCTQDCPYRAAGCVIDCKEYAAYKVEAAAKRSVRDQELRQARDYSDYKRDAIRRSKGKSYRRQGYRIEEHK